MSKDIKLVEAELNGTDKTEFKVLTGRSQKRTSEYGSILNKKGEENSFWRRKAEMIALGIMTVAMLTSACEPIEARRTITYQENSPTISETVTEIAVNTPNIQPEPTLVYTATMSMEEINKIKTATSVAATQEMISEISLAVSKFGLNPNRSYSFIGEYLVDKYNLVKMARWENGNWVETSLEEKYGHLVDIDNELLYRETKNINGNVTGFELFCVSTGNLWEGRYAIGIAGEEKLINTIEGECVFRDARGTLNKVNAVFSVTEDGMDPFVNVFVIQETGEYGFEKLFQGFAGIFSTDQVAINPDPLVNPELVEMSVVDFQKKIIYGPGEKLILMFPNLASTNLQYVTWGYSEAASPFITDQKFSSAFEYFTKAGCKQGWVKNFLESVREAGNWESEVDDIGEKVLPTAGAMIVRDIDWLNRQVYP